MKLEDIAFYVLVVVISSWIAKELIPEHVKQYWGYIRSIRQDHKKGLKGKYIFTWKITPKK